MNITLIEASGSTSWRRFFLRAIVGVGLAYATGYATAKGKAAATPATGPAWLVKLNEETRRTRRRERRERRQARKALAHRTRLCGVALCPNPSVESSLYCHAHNEPVDYNDKPVICFLCGKPVLAGHEFSESAGQFRHTTCP